MRSTAFSPFCRIGHGLFKRWFFSAGGSLNSLAQPMRSPRTSTSTKTIRIRGFVGRGATTGADSLRNATSRCPKNCVDFRWLTESFSRSTQQKVLAHRACRDITSTTVTWGLSMQHMPRPIAAEALIVAGSRAIPMRRGPLPQCRIGIEKTICRLMFDCEALLHTLSFLSSLAAHDQLSYLFNHSTTSKRETRSERHPSKAR